MFYSQDTLALQVSLKRLVSGSADGTARIWDYVCSLQQVSHVLFRFSDVSRVNVC